MSDQESRWGVASLHRRRHPRLEVSLPVEYAVRGPAPADDVGLTTTRTIGGGGLLLLLPGAVALGTALSLTLYLPAEPGEGPLAAPRAIRAEAVVVWTDLTSEASDDECRCGVAFSDIRGVDRQAILDFIARARAR